MIIPTNPNLPQNAIINCNRHQAPRGYQYIHKGGVCILVKRSTGFPVVSHAGTGFIEGTQYTTATALPSVSGVTNWIQNNKGLALVIGLGAAYLFTKK